MTANDLEGEALYTTDGKDCWKMLGYFTMPSCTLKNLETGELQTFGMGGLTAESFKRLVPKENQ
jgi:hypothetical protein